MTRASVLICTYNGEQYIQDQIDSILNQSVAIDKIYLFDYESTDQTLNIVQNIADKESRLILFEHPNLKSVAKSFIHALKVVGGIIQPEEILYICDQDDFWLFNKNETIQQLEFYKSRSPTLVHHDVFVTNDQLHQIPIRFYSNKQKNLLKSGVTHRKYLSTVIGNTICLNYAAIKFLSSQNFDKRIIMHDWFWASLIEEVGEVIFLNKALSFYRQHDSNVTGINRSKKINKKLIKGFANIISTATQISYIKTIERGKNKSVVLLKYLIKQKFYQEFLIVIAIVTMHKFILRIKDKFILVII